MKEIRSGSDQGKLKVGRSFMKKTEVLIQESVFLNQYVLRSLDLRGTTHWFIVLIIQPVHVRASGIAPRPQFTACLCAIVCTVPKTTTYQDASIII